MTDMPASTCHILPLTVIRRERKQAFPGRILVRKGQRIGANDPVVEARLNPKHTLLDVAMGLAVSRSQSEQYIRVKAGDQLLKGDLIAGPVGISRRVLRAAQNCQVLLVGTDQVLLELSENPAQVKAGMSGEVIEILADRGVVIETIGSLIQGNWGNGQVDFGVLAVLARESGDTVSPDQLDLSMRGAVIFGIHCDDEAFLLAAQNLPIRGLILASMKISLRAVAEKMEYPVLLLDGFGRMEFNKQAYRLLSGSARREVSVNAQPWASFEGKRPEIVIPLVAEGVVLPPRGTERFAVNQVVRSVRAPNTGKPGRLARLCGQVLLPSGIQAQAAEVQYEDGEKAILPLENLELML